MVSPSGWSEPAQTPSFDEFTVVLRGRLQVETRDAVHQVSVGQAIWAGSGEWIRYSTPGPEEVPEFTRPKNSSMILGG